MPPVPTEDKFMTLYPKDGGPPLRRHRVDAREMIKSGLYGTEPAVIAAEADAAPAAIAAPVVVQPSQAIIPSPIPPTREPTREDIGFIPDLAASAVKVLRKAGIHTVRQLRNTSQETLDQLELSGRALEALKQAREG